MAVLLDTFRSAANTARESKSCGKTPPRATASLEQYRSQRVILFGSAARRETESESDLDVLLVEDTSEPFVQRLETIAMLCPAGMHADILVDTPAELEQMVTEGNSFESHAQEQGEKAVAAAAAIVTLVSQKRASAPGV